MRIGVIGFEPTASCSQSRRSSQAELHPGNLNYFFLRSYEAPSFLFLCLHTICASFNQLMSDQSNRRASPRRKPASRHRAINIFQPTLWQASSNLSSSSKCINVKSVYQYHEALPDSGIHRIYCHQGRCAYQHLSCTALWALRYGTTIVKSPMKSSKQVAFRVLCTAGYGS